MMIIISANQAETFRSRKSQRRFSKGVLAIASRSIAAPG